ncbi:MAG: glycogen synthase GlgA [Saprospiraceae bacterium]|nr:glycogen synthase GlgA [Saprospiraceae bacterium]
MDRKLNIIMMASECVPYAKTGGLADVVGALPKELKKMGHDVKIIMPKYSSIDPDKFKLQRVQDTMGVWMGGVQEWCAVDYTMMEGDVPVFFIESWNYFGRDGIYNDTNNRDFPDNPKRFAFFTRAALQLCIDRNFQPDILHLHDWQTALGAAYQKVWHWNEERLNKAATVLTIHNMAHQGHYSKESYEYIGLGRERFTSNQLEDNGGVNFLKGGIQFADIVNTVSPTYAHETRSSRLGHGMESYLFYKGKAYVGILNGVDYENWDPAIDPHIPANYSLDDRSGKAKCKEALQRMFNLEVDPSIPIVGVVSRFADQKGLDLFYDAIHQSMRNMRVQFVVLGSGDKKLETNYMQLPAQYPGRVGTFVGYDNPKAHLIEAGSDFFAMPSRFEPCGLNQLYSLKYGTLPIVRDTGGLADTVDQYDEATGHGTGFKFTDNTPQAISNTIGWAVSTFYDRPHHIEVMIQRAMQKNYSWEQSALKYEEMYHTVLSWRGLS